MTTGVASCSATVTEVAAGEVLLETCLQEGEAEASLLGEEVVVVVGRQEGEGGGERKRRPTEGSGLYRSEGTSGSRCLR